METKLARIAELAKNNPKMKFTSLGLVEEYSIIGVILMTIENVKGMGLLPLLSYKQL